MRKKIAELLGIELGDNISLSKGIFTLRKEYYWHPKASPEEFYAKQLKKLRNSGYNTTDIEYGDRFAPFRGGESVKRNSHYWVKFKLNGSNLS